MSISSDKLITSLETSLPKEVLVELLKEYNQLKINFYLRKFRPTELNGARFAEYVLRLLEYVDSGTYTPFSTTLRSEQIINRIANNTLLPTTIRLLIPRLVRVILDIRNKRDVAHVGGEVNPNYSDSIFITHSVDWILTEIVRHYHSTSIDEAAKAVSAINEVQVPIVDDINGVMRVLDPNLKASDKVLIVLYSKQPESVSESDLRDWIEYKNLTNFRNKVLVSLHKQALIHYQDSICTLTRRGILYVEKHISSHAIPV